MLNVEQCFHSIGSPPLTYSPSITLTYLLFFIAPTLTSPLLFPLSPYFAPGRCFRTCVLIRDVEAVIFQPLPLPHPLPHLSLPLLQTKNEKTTVDNFFNFCGSVACFLLDFIIFRKQKPSFTAITLPTSLELIVPNYSVFLFLRYWNSY